MTDLDFDPKAVFGTPPVIVREICPNPSCFGGDVIVPSNGGLEALAICGICFGNGYLLTEAK